ncbi:MAG TPA: RND transporter [Syntrophobacteraceae bacterium]|nr:RND transporter [Syntrophobacteraceae bacterium]HBZ56237.1 RND transporter [Syntrophobacteraceae bacterium]
MVARCKVPALVLMWLMVTVSIALAGCAVGPNFRSPKVQVPPAWRGVGGPQPAQPSAETPSLSVATGGPTEVVDWWRSFNDPELNSLVGRAMASNLDLALAKARIRQARASRGVASSSLWPTVDASASYRRSYSGSSSSGVSTSSSSPDSTAGGGSIGSAENDLFRAGLDAAWELDIFGGKRRNVEAAEADLQAVVEDRRDVLVSLAAEVGNNYASLRSLQQQLVIARNNLETQRHSAEIARKRFEAGYVSGLDVASANAQVATLEAQVPVLESSIQATIYSLGVLLGQEPGALAQELMTPAMIPVTPPAVPVGLPSELLLRRPDIRKADAQLHAATARIGVATADLFPKISLTGSLGFSSSDLTNLANWSSRFWSMGPTVSWALFDGGKIRSNIEVQNALQEQALLTYRATVLTALKEVETALVAYSKEQDRRRALVVAVEQSRRAVDLAQKLYVAGKTDYLNVLTAQRSQYVSEDSLVQSVRSLTTDLIVLYKALGGGWEHEAGKD